MHEHLLEGMTWDSRQLMYAVREPYPGATGQAALIVGRVDEKHPFAMESAMAEEGVIFSDGMLDDAIAFNAGTRVNIDRAGRTGQLIR
jgi:hypothetical protein